MMRETESNQFSLCTLLIIVTWIALALGFWVTFGPHGFAVGMYIAAGSWWALSFTRKPTFRPLSNRRLKSSEVLTLLAICFVLHCLAMPAVQSNCQGRRRPPATPAGAANVVRNPFVPLISESENPDGSNAEKVGKRITANNPE